MADAHTQWPSAIAEAQLTTDLLAGTAADIPNAIAAAFLDPLTAHLQATYPWCDPDACATAAEEAILAVCRRPTSYDPAGLRLAAYLRMAAKFDLCNELRKERRHHDHRIPLPDVELVPDRGNDTGGPSAGWDDPRLVAAVAELGEPERAALELMRDGVRQTAAFAAPLGLGHLSGEEQAHEVKKAKDRILKRLRRAAGGDR